MFDEILDIFDRLFDEAYYTIKELEKAIRDIQISAESLPPREYGTKKYRKKIPRVKLSKNQYIQRTNRHLPYQKRIYS